jgi:hypothetical protein
VPTLLSHPFRPAEDTGSEPVATASTAATALAGAAPTTSAATETTVATGPLLCLVHAELATVQRQPIELRDGFGRRLSITHRHEGKASRPPRVTVDGDGHFTHFPCRGECRLQRRLVGFERKVSYEESISHFVLSSSDLWCGGTRVSRRRSRTRQRSAELEHPLSASSPQPARSGPAKRQAGETDEGQRDGCSVACRGSPRKPERFARGPGVYAARSDVPRADAGRERSAGRRRQERGMRRRCYAPGYPPAGRGGRPTLPYDHGQPGVLRRMTRSCDPGRSAAPNRIGPRPLACNPCVRDAHLELARSVLEPTGASHAHGSAAPGVRSPFRTS